MPTYISLLRGVNVSGQKKIGMKDLKGLYEEAGFTSVQTYIQSGNVIFKSTKKNKQQIAKQIEQIIAGYYNFEVTVVVLTPSDLELVIAENPYVHRRDFEEGKMYVSFLKDAAAEHLIEKIKDFKYNDDVFTLYGTTIYIFAPGGYGNTKINNNFFEAKLKVKATTRNWNTTKKLLEMSE